MPSTARDPVTVISLHFNELVVAGTALGHSESEREDERAREKAEKLHRKLMALEDEALGKPEGIEIRLRDSEYGTLLEALEFFVASFDPGNQFRDAAFDLLQRLLVEGGHVTPRQLEALRRRYGR